MTPIRTIYYNANNFVGALQGIEQFRNEYPEAVRPPMTGETTDLAGSLPEDRHTGSMMKLNERLPRKYGDLYVLCTLPPSFCGLRRC